MDFRLVDLKPISKTILLNLSHREERKSEDIAKEVNLTKRQVDAAVTKALIRYGFCVREARLTRLMKKDYCVIKITSEGERYLQYLKEQEQSQEKQGEV